MEILIILFLMIISAVISGYVVYKYLRPRLIAALELDTDTAEKNKIIQQEFNSLQIETDNLIRERDQLIAQKDSTLEQISNLNNSISAIEAQAKEAADLFFTTKMEAAKEHFEQALELERQKYQENVDSFNIQYNESVASLMESYNELSGNVALMKATHDAAVEAAKRAEEMRTQQDFYRIQLSESDIHEIELLREVSPALRDKEPLNKVIWKCYYEKPTTNLIGRVIGSGAHTGIYKITEIASGKCYVGQAANLADRWKQHIKRGVGAETPTRNKLYPAMIAAGPENFTFEVVEECARELLDEREDYWQDYFKAKEFGYSIK